MNVRILSLGLILILVSILVFAFRASNSFNAGNYFNWFNSKECSVSSSMKSEFMVFNVNYRTMEYMALSELNGEIVNDEKLKIAMKNYECCEHFLLKIFSQDTISDALSYRIVNEQEYYERIRFLSSDFGSKVVLIDGNDTLPCTFHHFERTYKMKPYVSINLIFEKKNKKRNNKMILIISPTIFNQSELRFEINESMLDEMPKLKI